MRPDGSATRSPFKTAAASHKTELGGVVLNLSRRRNPGRGLSRNVFATRSCGHVAGDGRAGRGGGAWRDTRPAVRPVGHDRRRRRADRDVPRQAPRAAAPRRVTRQAAYRQARHPPAARRRQGRSACGRRRAGRCPVALFPPGPRPRGPHRCPRRRTRSSPARTGAWRSMHWSSLRFPGSLRISFLVSTSCNVVQRMRLICRALRS